MRWSFDIEAAPRGKTVTEHRKTAKSEFDVNMFKPERVILARSPEGPRSAPPLGDQELAVARGQDDIEVQLRRRFLHVGDELPFFAGDERLEHVLARDVGGEARETLPPGPAHAHQQRAEHEGHAPTPTHELRFRQRGENGEQRSCVILFQAHRPSRAALRSHRRAAGSMPRAWGRSPTYSPASRLLLNPYWPRSLGVLEVAAVPVVVGVEAPGRTWFRAVPDRGKARAPGRRVAEVRVVGPDAGVEHVGGDVRG